MRSINLLIITILSLLVISCGNNTDKNNGTQNDTIIKPQVDVPTFNEDSAYSFIQKQLDFGPRVPNSDAHKLCAAWLESKLKSYNCEVIIQKAQLKAFNGEILNSSNIIGIINPEATKRILLCSHWDSRPWCDNDPDSANYHKAVDGANDGASGVGVLLEIARVLKTKSPSLGIDIIFFDSEDYGNPSFEKTNHSEDVWGLGSQYWAKNPHKEGYIAEYGILLDMVGVPGARFAHEGFSKKYASHVLSKVWSAAYRAGYNKYFISEEGGMINDDHLYINKFIGIPTIDIIHNDLSTPTGFFKYWHTTQDNMDCIDRQTLKAVGQTVLTVIFEEGVIS